MNTMNKTIPLTSPLSDATKLLEACTSALQEGSAQLEHEGHHDKGCELDEARVMLECASSLILKAAFKLSKSAMPELTSEMPFLGQARVG